MREQAEASWALAFLHRRIYFPCICSVGLPPHPGLDVKMHKRQVIPGLWLLAGTASGCTSRQGAHLQIKCGVISKLSFEGWSPEQGRQEEEK